MVLAHHVDHLLALDQGVEDALHVAALAIPAAVGIGHRGLVPDRAVQQRQLGNRLRTETPGPARAAEITDLGDGIRHPGHRSPLAILLEVDLESAPCASTTAASCWSWSAVFTERAGSRQREQKPQAMRSQALPWRAR